MAKKRVKTESELVNLVAKEENTEEEEPTLDDINAAMEDLSSMNDDE